MVRYRLLKQVGEGNYATVYKAELEGHEGYVAIKKVLKNSSSEVSFNVIREMVAFRRFDNQHVIKMVAVWMDVATISMAMEYMPYDLAGLVASNYKFSDEQILSFLYQMVDGLAHIHSMGMVHRDMKPSNVLVDEQGRLKIADFGISRDTSAKMTSGVCTLWYRAPELLLGDVEYSDKVDSWSLGCIVLEMKYRRPFFKGQNELSQITEIFSKLGCPENMYPWADYIRVERFQKEDSWEETINKLLGDSFSAEMRDLLGKLLQVDKAKRISLSEVLKMPVVLKGKGKTIPIDHEECHEHDIMTKVM